jgi:excisionase family DNA binding protein
MNDSISEQLAAFRSILSAYQEAGEASGSIKAIDHTEPQGGKADHVSRTSMVRPTTSDLICEVEIAARRCLSSGELAYFTLYYKTADVVVNTLPRGADDKALEEHVETFSEKQRPAVHSLDLRMRNKLGRRFIEIGLSPLSAYLEPRDVHGRKLKTKRSNVISIQACAADDEGFEPLLGVPEAAKLLRIHPKTLQSLARSGEVPCIRFGKYWRFRESSLDEWVTERLTSPYQSRRAS